MAKDDEYMLFRTACMAATRAQRAAIRKMLEQLEQLPAGKDFDEVSVARFRKNFGKPTPGFLAAMAALAHRQAVERQ
jgi:DNA-binding GntR family transcriptional regulator